MLKRSSYRDVGLHSSMNSYNSEHCSNAALPAAIVNFPSSFHGGDDHEAGVSSIASCAGSNTASSPVAESGGALSISNADSACRARKKRSYAGGLTESCNGKHGLGGGAVGAGCPRDRLQRHRLQVAGTVRIPEAWCGESRLREWVSYGDVEEALQPPGLFMARAALISARSSSPSASSPASFAPSTSPACEVSLLS